MMRKTPLLIFGLLVAICLAHAAYYYPVLPERVASHFGASGRPDAWSSKERFLHIYVGMVLVIAVLFPGLYLLLAKTPNGLINLPHKDYWLAPERRKETIAILSRQFLWFGSATLLLLVDMMQQTFDVHLGKAVALSHPLLSIAAYVVFSILWSVVLILQFMRNP